MKQRIHAPHGCSLGVRVLLLLAWLALVWHPPGGAACCFLNAAGGDAAAAVVVANSRRKYCRSNNNNKLLDASSEDAATQQKVHRRQIITATAAAALVVGLLPQSPSHAASSDSLGTRLAQRDASVLQNRLFNVPPAAQVYPDWMRGDWRVQSQFLGYLFPSTTISKPRLTQNYSGVAGFQKCSIAVTADVGKENVHYNFRIDPATGLEDRAFNFQQQIDAYLGYKAVQSVIYDGNKNPNRLSIDFVDYRTTNAERIELFCNARESEQYYNTDNNNPVFVCAEYVRQVTFGTGSTVGVPRQVATNYANFWTWRRATNNDGDNATTTTRPTLKGNLLTCAYLDPQDPMYFDEPKKPVAVYSHQLTAEPIATTI